MEKPASLQFWFTTLFILQQYLKQKSIKSYKLVIGNTYAICDIDNVKKGDRAIKRRSFVCDQSYQFKIDCCNFRMFHVNLIKTYTIYTKRNESKSNKSL